MCNIPRLPTVLSISASLQSKKSSTMSWGIFVRDALDVCGASASVFIQDPSGPLRQPAGRPGRPAMSAGAKDGRGQVVPDVSETEGRSWSKVFAMKLSIDRKRLNYVDVRKKTAL